MGNQVRVMVVDDSSSTRTMLREALALDGEIEVAGEAGGGHEAVTRVATLAPDVVLMDVRMPEGDGVEATRRIMADHPATKVVALTWSDDPATVREMLAAGAIGYVVKGGTIDELCSAIHRAATGEPDLDQRVLPAAMDDLRRMLEDERERREQVERLAAAKSEFVQVLSHEIRAPLTVISGALRALERAGLGAEELPLVQSATRRVEELEFLVEGLELVGAGAGTGGPAYPGQAVQAAADRLQAAPDAVVVMDDRWEGLPHPYLQRVTFELFSNAVRHGRRPIEVFARREARHGVLTVTDHGGWDDAPPSFDAFFAEPATAAGNGYKGDGEGHGHRQGFGLGLFVASRLCQASNGELCIQGRRGVTVAEARFLLH